MSHTCHARACIVEVIPVQLMCRKHWRMVTKAVQRAIWRAYRHGQCDDKRPSSDWHSAADAAIGTVAAREGRAVTAAQGTAMALFGIHTQGMLL